MSRVILITLIVLAGGWFALAAFGFSPFVGVVTMLAILLHSDF